MQEEIKVWLEDIEKAITEINEFLPDSISFIEFEKDLKTRRAIERSIEIIGEAMNRILKINPEIGISDSRKIVDTRNRIVHGYDKITAEIIWFIVQRYLPILALEIKSIRDIDLS